jgi:phosphotransferase family enzyme
VSLPPDPALPHLGLLLLDADAVSPLLERSLGRRAYVDEVHVARVAYEPGVRASVHYRLHVDGRGADAVAWSLAGRDLAARARSPRLSELARRVDGRSPAAVPVVYEAAADALVTWLPLDPRLSALAVTPRALAERLGQEPGGEPTIVPESYKPGARIVLRFGNCVLKAYGREPAYERGAAGLRVAAATPLRTPRLEACLPDLRLTVQTAVEGTTPTPEAAASAGGALVRRLHDADLAPPRVATPETILALAAEKAALAAHVVPALRPRLTTLLDRLRESMPSADSLVPSHGDFDADQLVSTADGDHVVLDFDDVCLAPPALDLATYLADLVCGRDQDLGRVEAVRAPLLAGYGAEPHSLDWYVAAVVLARAPHPFQRFVPGWPERVAGSVRAAEAIAA